ncbi:MAG: hypothetical protein CM1200mP29_02210 [Verrucomicrobiota bacterium]|nr:MAG: hypothetical protein CM1200mP29_02210 [Verrucomicrobiota bacterium]
MIVYPTGQCQETTRAQHYAQLGLGLLGGAAEVAWNQGVDLYGWGGNRILKGFEYTAKYGLGERCRTSITLIAQANMDSEVATKL